MHSPSIDSEKRVRSYSARRPSANTPPATRTVRCSAPHGIPTIWNAQLVAHPEVLGARWLNFSTVALGDETLASIRRPGGWNGVAALRPTPGLVSRSGMWDGYPSPTAQMGPMARTVKDLAQLRSEERRVGKECGIGVEL